MNTGSIPWAASIMHLWELTRRALPQMVNLRHLVFSPPSYSPAPSENLLWGCAFQLQSLVWKFADPTRDQLAAFLCTQNHLLHFEYGREPETEILEWLPGNACPNLISTSSAHNWISAFVHRRNIVALDIGISPRPYTPTPANHVVLSRLKYLRVNRWILRHKFPGIVLSNIILLEIRAWMVHVSHAHCRTT